MNQIFKTVSAAYGHVSCTVFVKATRRLSLSSESYRITEEVFLKGYRQAAVARHVGVSCQWVHSMCRELLEEINNRSSPEGTTDEKTTPDSHYHGHFGRMCFAITSQHEKWLMRWHRSSAVSLDPHNLNLWQLQFVMIPSHWFRRVILIVFIMEVAGGILWVTGRLSTSPTAEPMTQTLGSLIFLFGFYANTPLSVHSLAPRPLRNAVFQERLARIVAAVPDNRPVFLYDHADKEANTMGLLPSHSRIYVTIDLLTSMSDENMRGAIAHENAHVHERHISAAFTYVCYFAVSNHLLDNNNFFFAAFLLLLGIRRYCGYRADAGTVQSVGREAVLTTLRELVVLYPPKSWVRWFSFTNAYPTLVVWMQAVETEREALLWGECAWAPSTCNGSAARLGCWGPCCWPSTTIRRAGGSYLS